MKIIITILFLLLFFCERTIEDEVQKSVDQNNVVQSISRQNLDRPWLNMTTGLNCNTNNPSFSNLWSYGVSQMLKISNFSFTFPNYPINIVGIIIAFVVSVDQVPYLGVRENRISLFLPNTSEITTPVQTYSGWQTQQTKIVYPLITQDPLWGITTPINATTLTNPSFGFGIVVQNGASDTKAMITCAIATVLFQQITTTTTSTTSNITINSTSSIAGTTETVFFGNATTVITTKSIDLNTTKFGEQISTKMTKTDIILISVIGVIGIACIILIIVGVFLFLRLRKKKKSQLIHLHYESLNEEGSFKENSLALSNNNSNNIISTLDINKEIGRGRNGIVYLAKMGQTEVAAKHLTTKATRHSVVWKELEFYKELKHPNIVQYLGTYQIQKGMYYIVMEYCPRGSLVSFFKDPEIKAWLEVDHLVNILYTLAMGLQYLSSLRILHRDIAPRNILIVIMEQYPISKITDFESSIYTEEEKARYIENDENAQYAINYSAPEVIEQRQYSFASDIYSFGIVMYYVFNKGEKEYENMNISDVPKINNSIVPKIFKPNIMPDFYFEILKQCIAVKPKDRPLIETIIDYFNKYAEKQQPPPSKNETQPTITKSESKQSLIITKNNSFKKEEKVESDVSYESINEIDEKHIEKMLDRPPQNNFEEDSDDYVEGQYSNFEDLVEQDKTTFHDVDINDPSKKNSFKDNLSDILKKNLPK